MTLYTKNNVADLLRLLTERAENISPEIMTTVSEVISEVRKNGDEALYKYTEKFDKIKLNSLYVDEAEKARLCALVPDELKEIIDEAAENIYAFHKKQLQNS